METARRAKHLRLHCLTYRKLEDGFPLVSPISNTDTFNTERTLITPSIPSLRTNLLQYCTHLCGDDALVAELVLLSFFARV